MDTQSDAPTPRKNGFRQNFGKKALIFFVLACIAVVLYLIVNIQALNRFFVRAGEHIAPLVLGGIIAYLSNPILNFYEYSTAFSGACARTGCVGVCHLR